MFSLYPSNKLEHLSALLNGLLTAQPPNVFEPECILVENPGMQHWLHLDLAAKNGISMNLEFPLTSRFVWDIARVVLGNDAIPKHSPYRREVLRFKLTALLQNEKVLSHPDCAPLQQYWENEKDIQRLALRRMTLAIEIADAFEQYLLFRPQWLSAWEDNDDPIKTSTSRWQAYLWRQLTHDEPWHPASLLTQTVTELNRAAKDKQAVSGLPNRVILFAVNALAPSLLAFFDALAKHCDVHFFYLNPSVSYWGDIKTDKAQAYQQRKADFAQSAADEQHNRLLANLGQHGRDLLNRLTAMETFEISAFDVPAEADDSSASLLSHLQAGIYRGESAESIPEYISDASDASDDSITLVSCHTALRELQVLHDYLLKRMTADKALLGKDIVVLCPAIEDYAPFVYSVFSRPGKQSEQRISCSVSDRAVLLTDPHISAFMAMLELTDSRFTVTSVMALLDYPDIAQRFGIDADGIEKIAVWLNHAAIRWGLNGQQKAEAVQSSQYQTGPEQNSWEWGLQRLLLGMVSEDSPSLIDDWLSVPDVEGLDGVLLGNLIRFISFLQNFSASLKLTRTMARWVDVLRDISDQLFAETAQRKAGFETILRTLSDLKIQVEQAGFDDTLSLAEIKELLSMAFSMPDVRNQFLTGHVTFCSMMPMRSVPFKIVAVLGLNDGQFPRKSVPQSLNLMSFQAPEPGDRSRAKEDRYLFLEAIISAREALYLSYQGAHGRDDSERQPSPALSLVTDEINQIAPGRGTFTQFPMHHFSPKNYHSPRVSSHGGGYRLASGLMAMRNQTTEHFKVDLDGDDIQREWDVNQLAKCFENPLVFLAKQRLGVDLQLTDNQLLDDEPFDVDWLTQYQTLDAASSLGFEHALERVKRSGAMPDNTIAESIYEQWESGLARLQSALPNDFETLSSSSVLFSGDKFAFSTSAKVIQGEIVDYHLGVQSAKRKVFQWLRHLVTCAESDSPIQSQVFYIDWKQSNGESNGAVKRVTYSVVEPDDAKTQLLAWEQALQECLVRPSFYHAKLGEALARTTQPESVWHTHMNGNMQLPGIVNDPYFAWMCDTPPALEDWLDKLVALYQPMVANSKDAKVKSEQGDV